MVNVNFIGMYGIIKTKIKKEIVYRFNFLVWSFIIPTWIIVDYFLWKSIYSFSGQTVIRGMTFETMISYYVASMIVGVVAGASFDEWIADKIRTGKLIKFINYPINFIHFLFSNWLASRIFNLFIFVPSLLLLGYLLVGFNIFHSNFVMVIISVILASILTFSFVLLFAMMAFWFKDIRGVKQLRQGITWFMSGAILPLNLFPNWFQKISFYLPFQYMRYVPAQLFIGAVNIGFNMIVFQCIWVLIMLAIVIFVWDKAYKQFTGAGV